MNDTRTAKQRANDIFSQGKPLDEEAVRALLHQDPDAAVFYILLLQSKTKMPQSPTAPSGMVPPYQKENSKKKGKKPGRKPGHQGERRKPHVKIDRQEEHRLERCPDCDSPLEETHTL